jgi:hypothetical protein
MEQHEVLLHGEEEMRIAIDDDGVAVTNSFIDAEKHPMKSRKSSVIRKRRDDEEKSADPTNEIEGMKKPYVDSPPQSPRLIPAASSDIVEKYKQMIRASTTLPIDEYQEFGRSLDFLGTTEILKLDRNEQESRGFVSSSPRSSPYKRTSKTLKPKWGKPDPEDDTQARPSAWLGSPSTKRMSYRIKEKVTLPLVTEFPPPPEDLVTPKQTKPKVEALESPSSVPTGERRSVFKNPTGAYNEVMSASDSRLLLPPKAESLEKYITEFPPPEDLGTPKQIKPKLEALEAPSSVPTGDRRSVFKNPTGAYKMVSASDSRLVLPQKNDTLEKYKAMIRSSNFSSSHGVYEDIGRSQQFLGQSEIIEDKLGRLTIEALGYPVSSPKPGSNKSHRHKWGAPDPEDATQARPTEWMGSPSAGRRKSYRIKDSSNLEVAPPPPVSLSSLSSPKTVLASPYEKKVIAASSPPKTPVATREKIGGKRFSDLYQVFESPAPH